MAKRINAWGDADRYYVRHQSDDATLTGGPWEQTLDHVLPDCRAKVERTVALWNQRVRNQLTTEISFRLLGRQIPIRVTDGLPAPLFDVLEQTSGLEVLLFQESLLRAVERGTAFMESVRDLVRDQSGRIVGPARPREIRLVHDTAKAWLELLKKHDLSRTIRGIEEDVLGAYFLHQHEVRIYWLAIGIYSVLLSIPLEGLTIVVLAHELAHAYTHIGYDIDGHDWPTRRFAATDLAIIEGLAQFYAQVVCTKFEKQMPEAIDAFDRLMEHQSGIYKTHTKWVEKDEKESGEIIRVSLVECRRSGKDMHRHDFTETVERRRREITGR